MASSGMLLALFCLLSVFQFAYSRNVNAAMDESATVLEYHPSSNKLGDTYCCRRNGFGCQQECDSALKYFCCIKNGFGCQQLCESGSEYECCLKNGFGCIYMCKKGIPHYCCEKNGFGCTKMCPKTSNLNIALPNAE